MKEIPQIRPADLPEAHGFLVVDVREPSEWDHVHLPGAVHIPLGKLQQNYSQLPVNRKLLLLCHHGIRSQRAAEFLAKMGYDVSNLSGGIDRWSLERDASVIRY